MTIPAFRFAPSPNGRLHLGHAYSALLNDVFAQRWRGRSLLRIEDIDTARSRPDFVVAIFADLAWLGLRWEEPVRRQSRHGRDYEAAAETLRGRGLLYPCFCTRGEVARAAEDLAARSGTPMASDPDGAPLYPGTCRALSVMAIAARTATGLRPAWRLHTGAALAGLATPPGWTSFDSDGRERLVAADPARWGDPVVVRRDIPTSYHLSVVVDDALQTISHVVRGRDLEAATDIHVLLQAALGLPTPRYHHHALIRDVAGGKLSKSMGSQSLADLRASGETADTIRRALGFDSA